MTAAKAKVPPIRRGMKRRFMRCRAKGCGRVYFYDFIPYGMSRPIIITPCGHSLGSRDLQVSTITEAEYHRLRLAELAKAARRTA
jgi:hypothetical protein